MTQVPADYMSTTSSYNYEQPLPSVARTNALTRVPPAKKITFFKSGDPQFAGVKMAINQRSFKSFNALMDDLSHRVPLPFGVRTITTPRGIHCINELDQLEDGGWYLCSDKKYVKPINIASGGHRPGPPRNGRPSSTLRRAAQEGKLEDYSTPFTHHGPRIPKKITLVKNGESGFRRSIILNRRNARSFKTLLDEISEILQFPVKKLYTADGKKIDSMQALLHCPSILVCVGREPFKPISMENLRKHSVEKLPDLAPRSNGNNVNENNEMDFGLKAKKSVIHPRSASSNRSMRFSLSSEKSYPNGLVASPDNGAPFSNSFSHTKPGDLVHSLVNDDIEKRVHVNKDGSLSVEMKVRFRLLNDETLQWSTQIKKSNLMNQRPCEESGLEEDSGVDPIQKMNPEASSEADDSLYPCDIDSYMSKLEESEYDEAHCHSCGKKHQDYDIWKNPMHTSQREEPGVRSTWHTRSSCSSTSSRRRVVHKKMASVDSLHTTTSEEFSEHIVQESSSYSETIESRVAYRSVKKCRCRSDLSTGASNGEDQQEYTRASTSNSQRPSSLGLVSHSSCENNLDTQDGSEDHEARKNNSQNEDEVSQNEVSSVKCLKEDVEEVESSRVGSIMSRSSVQSRLSKKNICEETSSVGRSMSSSSLQKANQEDNTRSSTPANSMHSKSSNCTTPRGKSEQGDHSDDNAVVSSFSSESCPKKEAEDAEAEEEENEINEVSSVSAKSKPSQSIRGESSEGERCSTQGTSHSRASGRNRKTNDSDDTIPCNASCSSRGSKKSKHSHINLDARSEMSISSLESTPNKKKSSLHADDLRSGSRTSNYSKSSCEIKKKSTGDPKSHNSGSSPTNISSTSEAEAITRFAEEQSSKSTVNGYSESSKGSKKRSYREETSKPSSLCSSVSNLNGKPGECCSKINSEPSSSRQGSISESVCSKGDRLTEAGIRNGKPSSVSSRVSSKSEVKDKCLLTQKSEESNDRYSQSNLSQSSKSRPIKTRNLGVKMSNSSRASLSETLSVCSMHRPAPPKGKPKSKKIRSAMLKNSSRSSIGSESVLTTGKEQKEIVDSSKTTSYGSKSAATGINDEKNQAIDDSCSRKVEEELEGMGMQEEGSDLMPSALPNTSPEEVVQEWLRKIPSETLLMKDEMEDDAEEECVEATTEVSHCTNAEEISEDEQAEKNNVEEVENEAEDEVGKETEDTAVIEEAEDCVNQEEISEVVSEAAKADQAECNQSVTSSQNNNRRDLPTEVQTSVQIMKALLSSKHDTKFDRSNSLPEVSPTMGRKLSNSANILITCLASLQLLDEESEDPSDKSKRLNKPRYMELLNIFQALWLGGTAEKSGPSSDQEASEQAKTASGCKVPKSANYDFTPMSSSGVDVSSGSGGSGEEITAGPRDGTLTTQKTAQFKSGGQVDSEETGTELTEAEEKSKEEEQSSRPSTARSKSKGEEKAQSTRDHSLTQEAEESKEDQYSNCENGLEEGEENENKETGKLTENGEQEEAEAVNDELLKENVEEEADQLDATADANVHDADGGTELNADLEEQLEKESPNDPQPAVDTATVVDSSLVQQNSMDPDPTWVLKLLKKIEKEFMAHYVSAMNDFKVRWNLQNNEQMDEMILELKEEVSKRIQRSIEKELRKIKARAGKRMPRPPDEPLRRESTLQTEQRRRRLQTMHKKSLFNDKNGTQTRLEDTSDLSFHIDEDTAFSATFEASISKQTSEEEYCPCDSCVRKKMASKPIRNPVVATNAPVMKAFDLQQILRLKKNDEEACVSEVAQDIKTIPRSSVEEAAENGEVKDEETKEEEEKEEAEEVGEEKKEKEEEEEEAKEEEEVKEEEDIMKAAEEEREQEEVEGETEEKENEEAKEEAGEETKEEEEIKEAEEEETKEEEEEEAKEEEEETKEEEEEVKDEEEETKEEEEEEAKEEEEETKEEEEVKDEEEETKEEEEEEAKEEEEETKEEEEVKDEEEETKEEEEEEAKEEEEETKEEEEVKDEEEETKEEEEEEAKEEEEETKEEEEEEVKDEEEETKEEEEEEAKEEEEETKEEEEVKDEEEETKEEEEEEAKEEEEETKEEEEVKEEEEETKEEEEVKDEEEETKEEEEEEVKEEEEVREEEEEKREEEEEEEEVKDEEEEETKEEEGEMQEDEGEKKEEEEEEVKEEEEETKEDIKEEEEETNEEEEEEAKEEEEEAKEDEDETKDEEEKVDEEEETKEEEEEAKEDEEEMKEEEKEVQEGEEVTMEDEEAKEDEEETHQDEQEVEEEEENQEEGEEQAKEEEEGVKDKEETKEDEEEADEEEQEETQAEEQEAEEKTKAVTDNEAEEAEEPENEDAVADVEEETSECRGDADGSGTGNNPEGDAAEGTEEAEQDEAEAVEDGNNEEPTIDDLDNAHENHEDKSNKVSKKASKAKGNKTSKRLQSLKKEAFSCYSSVGNFSQQSQKGSEDEGEGEEECEDDNNPVNNHSNGEVQSEESSKPSQMYPESEEEDEDEASSCTDPVGDEEQADAEGADTKEAEHTDEVQAAKKKENSDEIDQDDLDF